ncbi:transcriptional regulator [Cellulomonas hominis]|uniref:Transcriptional regulator n=1 Tax=Cellulomonas hominis TaxID=156981 RepID=A0A511FAQ9_9CELL|nr:MarR family transcriptional regulator [Cellulomonas hominis]MBB5472398.1 DNA-binding MarR family transcriptional regulator [Cellulomonas hominis]NKY06698.1 MarR family transcriptional regulator [Cellulomonas hominis]GEL45664.1 transcriptional regulator [Cellulomonas hominis]
MGTTTGTHEDVRWLTADEQRAWRAYRDGTARLLDVLAHDLEQETGLSLGEYEVLVRLSEAPGRTLRMSELAGELAHSRSRLTHTVRRMESDGLVERAPCLEDARGVNCTMTETGWQRLVAAAPAHVASVRTRLVDVLTPEQMQALGHAMGAVGAALQAGCAAALAEAERDRGCGRGTTTQPGLRD